MKRLIKEALYSNELVEEHYFRALRRGEGSACDTTNPNADWDHLPETIRRIDPDGERSYALLQEVIRLCKK